MLFVDTCRDRHVADGDKQSERAPPAASRVVRILR